MKEEGQVLEPPELFRPGGFWRLEEVYRGNCNVAFLLAVRIQLTLFEAGRERDYVFHLRDFDVGFLPFVLVHQHADGNALDFSGCLHSLVDDLGGRVIDDLLGLAVVVGSLRVNAGIRRNIGCGSIGSAGPHFTASIRLVFALLGNLYFVPRIGVDLFRN